MRAPLRTPSRATALAAVALVSALAPLGCKRARARSGSADSTPTHVAESSGVVVDGVSDDKIRIAHVGSFTGAQAGLGTEIYRGAMAYFLEVNANGGIHDRKIEMVAIDDRYTAEGAEQGAERALKDENAFVLFGASGTESLGGILRVLQKSDSNKTFLWGSNSGAEVSREGALAAFAFNVRGSLKSAGAGIVDAYAAAGFKHLGIVTQDDGFGKSAGSAAREAAERKGLSIVLELPISKAAKPEATTANELVQKMRSAGVDAIVLATTYNPASVFIRDAREQGWNVPAAVMGTPDTMVRYLTAHEKKTGKRMTNAVLGCINVPPVTATELPAVVSYRDLMDKRNPRLPTEIADANYRPLHYASSSFEGFITARVLGEALERAGRNLTRDALRRAAESITGWDPGVGQRITYGPGDNQGFDTVWLAGVKNEEFVIVPDMKKYLTERPEPVLVAKDDVQDKAHTDKTTPAAAAAKTAPKR